MSQHVEEYGDEYDEQPAFQKVKRQSEKAPNIKSDRRQQGKAFGRAVRKDMKQRRQNGFDKP